MINDTVYAPRSYFSPICISSALALIVSSLGISVLLGWYSNQIALIQVHSSFVPMQYNTALGFLLSGCALLASIFNKKKPALVLSFVVALIGALTLIEYIFQINLGIDQLLMNHDITTQTSHLDRMAPNTALCFFLSGSALLASHLTWRTNQLVLVGATVTGLGLIVFLGYLIGLETTFGWGYLTRMAIHTAVGFILLGSAITLWGISVMPKITEIRNHWAITLVGVALTVLVLTLWQALVAWEHRQIQKDTENQLHRFQEKFEINMQTQLHTLERMAQQWAYRGGIPRQEWELDIRNYIQHLPFFQAIEWVDDSFHVRWVVPLEGNEAAQDLNIAFEPRRREALIKARDQIHTTVSHSVKLVQGDRGFLVYVPLYINQKFDGFILGVFRIDDILTLLTGQDQFNQHFRLQIIEKDQVISDSSQPYEPEQDKYKVRSTVKLGDIYWQAELTPTSAYTHKVWSPIPYLVLFGGLISIALLHYFYYLRQRDQRKTRLLQEEIAKRKRNEIALAQYMKELERSNKELNDFAYVASHDLKAPLRGIMQLANWIEEDSKDQLEEQSKEFLGLMQNRVSRLERLLDDLLAYSRVGRKQGNFKTVDTTGLAQDIFQLLEPPEGFTLTCQNCLPTFVTLSVPFEQLLRNLISNAIKHHNKTEGIINISATIDTNGFQFIVSDDGPGIPPEQHDRVFGIFQTLKSRDEVEGSGMGLAIVKKLLDNYQCTIHIESNGTRGTRMCFTWPTETTLRELIND